MSGRSPFLEPLFLEPLLVPKVWGGKDLAALFRKDLPGGTPLGESWEVYDRPEGSSRFRGETYRDKTLQALLREDREGILGPSRGGDAERFPLAVKFLDAAGLLSLQVHPSWEYAERAEGDQGKAEAWFILAARPGSKIYRGLRPGTTRADLEEACRSGDVERLVFSFTPRPGQVVWIPPGTVHAMGGGVVAYEIQTNSDVTYRLFDWNRLGLDGRPRELHVEKALDVIDFSGSPPRPSQPSGTGPGKVPLLETPWFLLERIQGPWEGLVGGGESFTLLTVVEGRVRIGGKKERPAAAGDTLLLPARSGPVEVGGAGASPWSLLSARPGRSLQW